MSRILAALAAIVFLTLAAWWWPNRPQAADVPMLAERFNSVSFAPFRPGHSPLRDIFPTAAEVDADMALVARRVRAIRTYASIEGNYEVAEIAARHGVRMWKGAWLGSNRAQNERELARLIEIANAHPETVERVVVGNEVLLRRDLPPSELIAALDRVKAAVRQPVTYADVWEFWVQFPEIAAHVDIITIHILPYWEDEPLGVERTMAHVRDVYQRMQALFPGRPIAIGEIGWPSRGRWREDAAPSRVNQAVFIREFIALSREMGFDYNLIEAFDQVWKYKSEGTVGAAWGLWTADRAEKFPLSGPVVENPDWPWYAGLALVLAGCLFILTRFAFPGSGWREALAAGALGNALAYAVCGGVPYAFDEHLMLAVTVNLVGQGLLAALLMRRVAGAPAAPRSGRDATVLVRGLLLGRWRVLRGWRGFAFEDLCFVFAWAAMVLQVMLLVDPRYRDFPFATFAVPLVVVLVGVVLRRLPRGGGGREEWVLGLALVGCALASAAREHPSNLQAMGWTVCALILALPVLLRMLPSPASPTSQK
ncbi:glycoside hydrolase family 17 protein [Plastoroseomonas arctica]|uniref:Endo-1,3-beta-glucanase btgC n=1 Tax=Plastoroseomonas arctica TaxID=1509237 RepID=A0AAF1JVY0_9PROT|nr:glycoside hydrolase [Plastoroseomonas arctica]MBR0654886.1 glycoside hydrolase [Plastoroseomonas arctica]